MGWLKTLLDPNAGFRRRVRDADNAMLPPTVTVDYRTPDIREYWLQRVDQHYHDRYAGVPQCKFPEDLRVFEHLLWRATPNVVIELGTHLGGSTLWFRDRLLVLASYGRITEPLVVTIDTITEAAREHIGRVDPAFRSIKLVEADVTDPLLPQDVEKLLPRDARCLVVEDSAHVYETTYAALEGFSRFVPAGGFFVVEDGCVDIEEMRPSEDWPRGVLPAIADWLATPAGRGFTVRRDLELYGICAHPNGVLQRLTR
jgi:cephalosporin hydroxylase